MSLYSKTLQEESGAIEQAREWEAKMVKNGYYREHFFQEFSEHLNTLFDRPISLLEVGSGPGHLALNILRYNQIAQYTLLDLSESMHRIAKEHLADYRSRLQFRTASFLDGAAFKPTEEFDVAVCMQSIHEVRDKTLAASIYRNIWESIKPDGYLLVCDFICGGQGMHDTSVFMTKLEQSQALIEGGFKSAKLLSTYEGLTLYCAQK
ncbi:class I SAM-dependent methyltransferase [Vibrio profundum]|uniref:class I SAM-dependent methyltransferase n=1 Tax=Vibrio profundum TaxID=2910247 RepID=UPI003D09FDBC